MTYETGNKNTQKGKRRILRVIRTLMQGFDIIKNRVVIVLVGQWKLEASIEDYDQDCLEQICRSALCIHVWHNRAWSCFSAHGKELSRAGAGSSPGVCKLDLEI